MAAGITIGSLRQAERLRQRPVMSRKALTTLAGASAVIAAVAISAPFLPRVPVAIAALTAPPGETAVPTSPARPTDRDVVRQAFADDALAVQSMARTTFVAPVEPQPTVATAPDSPAAAAPEPAPVVREASLPEPVAREAVESRAPVASPSTVEVPARQGRRVSPAEEDTTPAAAVRPHRHVRVRQRAVRQAEAAPERARERPRAASTPSAAKSFRLPGELLPTGS